VASAPLWDADHNGTCTCDEWKQYASRLFNQADRNHDGYIDATEFKTIQQTAPMFKEADLAYFDENRDGRVSRNEFVNTPNPLFSRYDKNGDCKVTPAELKGGLPVTLNHQKNAEGDEVVVDSSVGSFLNGCSYHCIPIRVATRQKAFSLGVSLDSRA